MLTAALALIAIGVVMAGSALSWGFDFAVAVRRGWHVVVFPPPLWLSVVLLVIGVVALLASFQSR